LRWLDLFGFEYYLVARFYDAGAGNIRLRSRLSLGTTLDEQIETDLQAISSTAADRLYILAPLPTWDPKRHYLNVHDDGITAQGSFILRGVRTTGSANVRIDYIAVAPRPFISIGESKIYTSPPTNVRLKGRIAAGYLESGGVQPDKFQKTLPVKGDEIEFWPQKFNSVMLFLGDESTAPAIGTSIDFDNVWIRPRWGLLT
jgi:hypothetical protein